MSDIEIVTRTERSGEGTWANVVYVVYLIGLVTAVPMLIGLIMAYINRAGAADWVKSHHQYQIRTFWIGLFYGLLSVSFLPYFGLGFLLAGFTFVWWIVRSAKGLGAVSRGEPIKEPTTWLW